MSNAAQALMSLSKQVHKGLESINLRQIMKPEIMLRLCETICSASAKDLCHTTKSLVGEAISLNAGPMLSATNALDAIFEANAESFVANRTLFTNKNQITLDKENLSQIRDLLVNHRDNLMHWVETGIYKHEQCESDMTKIGALINNEDIRKTAISTVFAANEIIIGSINLFLNSGE